MDETFIDLFLFFPVAAHRLTVGSKVPAKFGHGPARAFPWLRTGPAARSGQVDRILPPLISPAATFECNKASSLAAGRHLKCAKHLLWHFGPPVEPLSVGFDRFAPDIHRDRLAALLFCRPCRPAEIPSPGPGCDIPPSRPLICSVGRSNTRSFGPLRFRLPPAANDGSVA